MKVIAGLKLIVSNLGLMGLPRENDLLATTSEQIMEPESKFGTQKN